ncbi:DUF7837 family putative zinc-binding protein [Halovenus marina]|uniref:DUF7837 family putative zinc-binding protein n=1 Tax=Halovenus marina TaxID=3396621 RepID=UPI003F57ED19
MLRDRKIGADEPILGVCPDCNIPIPSANLVIKYKTAGGWPRFLAECPRCKESVYPK